MLKKWLSGFVLVCFTAALLQGCGLYTDPDVNLAAKLESFDGTASVTWEPPPEETAPPPSSEPPSSAEPASTVSLLEDVTKNPIYKADPKDAPKEDPQYKKEQQKKQEPPVKDTLPPAPPPPPVTSASAPSSAPPTSIVPLSLNRR